MYNHSLKVMILCLNKFTLVLFFVGRLTIYRYFAYDSARTHIDFCSTEKPIYFLKNQSISFPNFIEIGAKVDRKSVTDKQSLRIYNISMDLKVDY